MSTTLKIWTAWNTDPAEIMPWQPTPEVVKPRNINVRVYFELTGFCGLSVRMIWNMRATEHHDDAVLRRNLLKSSWWDKHINLIQMENKKPKPEDHPVLEQAAKEIAAILKKHDIAGFVQMFTPGHNKYALNLQPSWSVIAVDVEGKMRLTPPLVDPENPQAAETKILNTVQMLANMRIYTGKITLTLAQCEMAVRQSFKIETKPGPSNPQEN